MTAFVVLAAVIALAVGGLALMLRWAGHDGGPRPEPLRHAEAEWSPGLPSHPYPGSHSRTA